MAKEREPFGVASKFMTAISNFSGNSSLVENICQKLEDAINDETKSYLQKVDCLVQAYENVIVFLGQANTETADALFLFMYRHTLHIILFCSNRLELTSKVQRKHLELQIKHFSELMIRKQCKYFNDCLYLKTLLDKPWGKFSIAVSSHLEDMSIRETFFKEESALLIAARIESIIDSKQKKPALRILQMFRKHRSNLTDDEKQWMIDLHLFLAFHCGKKKEFLQACLELTFEERNKFVRRCLKGSLGISFSKRLTERKFRRQVADAVIDNTLFQVTFQPLNEQNLALYRNTIELWAAVKCMFKDTKCKNTDKFKYERDDVLKFYEFSIKRVITTKVHKNMTAKHLYIFADIIRPVFGEDLIKVYIELYTIGLNLDQNRKLFFEQVKKDVEKCREVEVELANALFQLSLLTGAHVKVACECLLSAFCLKPTEEKFEVIKSMAEKLGKIGETTSVHCPSKPPYYLRSDNRYDSLDSSEDRTLASLANTYMKFLISSKNYDARAAPCYLVDNPFDLRRKVNKDLVNIIGATRNRMVSWILTWPELKFVCEKMIEKGSDFWAELELKFLKIDYSQFKDKPSNFNMYGGIERGYGYYINSDTGSEYDFSSSSEEYKTKRKRGRPRGRPRKAHSSSDSDKSYRKKLTLVTDVIRRSGRFKRRNASDNEPEEPRLKRLKSCTSSSGREIELQRLEMLKSCTSGSGSNSETEKLTIDPSNKRLSDSDYETKRSDKVHCSSDSDYGDLNKLILRPGVSTSRDIGAADSSSSDSEKGSMLSSLRRSLRVRRKPSNSDSSESNSSLKSIFRKTACKKYSRKRINKKIDNRIKDNLVVLVEDLYAKNSHNSFQNSFNNLKSKLNFKTSLCENDSSELSSDCLDNESKLQKVIRKFRNRKYCTTLRNATDSDYESLRKPREVYTKYATSFSDTESRKESQNSGSECVLSAIKLRKPDNRKIGTNSSDSDYGTLRRSERILKMSSSSSFERDTDDDNRKLLTYKYKPKLKMMPSSRKYLRKCMYRKVDINAKENGNVASDDSSNDDIMSVYDGINMCKTKGANLNPRILLHDIYNSNRVKNYIPKVLSHILSSEKGNVCDMMSDDISKTFSGLTSLEMIVPVPTQPTVQVVQLQNLHPAVTHSLQSTTQSQQHVSSSEPGQSTGGFSSTNSNTTNSVTQTYNSNINEASSQNICINSNDVPSSSTSTQQVYSSTESVKPLSTATQVICPLNTSGFQVDPSTPTGIIQRPENNNAHSSSGHIHRIGQSLHASVTQPLTPSLLLSVQTSNLIHSSKLTNSNRKGNNSTYKTSEENSKPPDNVATRILKYVYKDGKLLQMQDQQGAIQSTATLVESQTSNLPKVPVQGASGSEQAVKILDSSCVAVKDKSSNTKEVKYTNQIATLPKFQQAFGKSMYQPPAATVQVASSSNSESSDRHSECSSEYITHAAPTETTVLPVCTVLSKAVQTSNKEPEEPGSGTDQSNKSDNESHRSSSVSATSTIQNSQNTRNIITHPAKGTQERSGIIQSTSTSGTVNTSNSNVFQRKPLAILKPTPTTPTVTVTKLDENKLKSTKLSALISASLHTSGHLKRSTSGAGGPTKVSIMSPGSCVAIQGKAVEAEKKKPEASVQTVLPATNVQRVALPTNMQKNVRRQPVLQPTKFSRPVVQIASGNNQLGSSVVALNRNVQAVLTANSSRNTRSDTLMTRNSIETSVSSKTLEQLREFESVLEQVTNTSQMKERNTVQPQPTGLSLNQQLILPQNSANNNPEFTNTNDSQSPTVFQPTSTNSAIHDVHGRVNLTFINQSSSTSLISSSNQKVTSNTPVVVVQSCSRSVTTALSSTCQSSSSPAPAASANTSIGKITIKTNKTTKSKSASKTNPTTSLKVSTLQKPQQKPQEDEITTQRIYAILDEYAEKLRNSPELKNKPAPRRRSNPPTNPSPTSKRKKSTQTKSKIPSQQASCSSSGMEMSPGSEDIRTIGSEDSSNGQISQAINSPQNRLETSTPTGDLSSEASESLDSKDSRLQHKLVLDASSSSTLQNRAVIVQDTIQSTVINVEGTKVLRKQVVVGGTAAMPLISLSNMPGGSVRQVLLPVSTDGRIVLSKVPKMYRVHQVTMPSGSPLLLQPMCVNKPGSNIKQVKSTVISGISSQSLTGVSAQPAVVLPSDGSFTLSSETGESVAINLDNTILLNTTSASSLLTTSATTQITISNSEATLSSGNDVPVTCLKPDNLLSLSSILPVISTTQDAQEKLSDKNKPTGEVDSNSQLTCITFDYNKQSSGTSTEEFKVRCLANKSNDLTQHDQEQQTGEENDFSKKVSDDNASDCNGNKDGNDNKSAWSVITGNKSPQSVDDKDEFSSSRMKQLSLIQNQESSFMPVKTGAVDSSDINVLKRKRNENDCDDSVSSDSGSSGRVKNAKLQSKTDFIPEMNEDTDSPWRYTVVMEEFADTSEPICFKLLPLLNERPSCSGMHLPKHKVKRRSSPRLSAKKGCTCCPPRPGKRKAMTQNG